MARFYEKHFKVFDGDGNERTETELRVEIVFGVEARSADLKKPDAADRVATEADKTRYAADLTRFENDKADKAVADAATAEARAKVQAADRKAVRAKGRGESE